MMAFDPSEARDRRGKWTKLAQAIKKLSEADHTTVANAIGELPKGGHGNRASIRGVEIRRHQSGAVNVKIGGESRQYASHEDAARAVSWQSVSHLNRASMSSLACPVITG